MRESCEWLLLALLALLAHHGGRVVTQGQILEEVSRWLLTEPGVGYRRSA